MLMAAGRRGAAAVFAHGWLLVGGEKMSKSKLTGIAPTQITDVVRLRRVPLLLPARRSRSGRTARSRGRTSSARYQAELANGFGNLASRTTAMVERYFEGIVPPPGAYTDADLAIHKTVADAASAADAAIERFRIDEAITAIWTIVDALNLYITENEPWALAKDDARRERLGTVLYTAAEGLRALAVLLSPVMPKSPPRSCGSPSAPPSRSAASSTSRSARPAVGR